METAIRDKHTPMCAMSHKFINKLTVIVGSCQLLQEKAEELDCLDCDFPRRISVIESIARELADELKEHECELESLMKLNIFSPEEAPAKVAGGK